MMNRTGWSEDSELPREVRGMMNCTGWPELAWSGWSCPGSRAGEDESYGLAGAELAQAELGSITAEGKGGGVRGGGGQHFTEDAGPSVCVAMISSTGWPGLAGSA